jgi:MOSC domain-containing protein YiiM
MNEWGRVISVNVGRIANEFDGRQRYTTGIGKRPIAGSASLERERIVGDEIADLKNHGGPDRALYAYAAEDYAWWEAELGRPLNYGLFGENLTLTGIDVNGASVGERWRIGDAIVRVTSPRIPCFKLAHVVGEANFVRRFAAAHRPGAYLAIERAASIESGDDVEILSRPEKRLTLRDFTTIYFEERERAVAFLGVPDMTDAWRAWALEQASPQP